MALRVQTFAAGPVETNAYLVSDDATNEALIIDAPQGVAAELLKAVQAAGLRLDQIVITHVHWDHVVDAAELKEATGVPLVAHPLAVERLEQPPAPMMDLPFTIPPVSPDRLLDDGDEVRLGDHTFRVLHLPGHDPAHIVLFSEADRVFLGGDVVFPGGHGRVDIPGADQDVMLTSLARVAELPPDTVVYPGHGRTTRIGDEPWLLELRGRGAAS